MLAEPEAVAPLTRLAGDFTVKKPAMKSPWLTWTALDVGGPCVEAFGMNIGDGAPALAARPRTPRSCFRRQIKQAAFAMLLVAVSDST